MKELCQLYMICHSPSRYTGYPKWSFKSFATRYGEDAHLREFAAAFNFPRALENFSYIMLTIFPLLYIASAILQFDVSATLLPLYRKYMQVQMQDTYNYTYILLCIFL